MCFVCSHFAAHRENVAGRNSDFSSVCSRGNFDVGADVVDECVRCGSVPHWKEGSVSINVMDHDFVFWFGDLNYRIDESLSTEEVFDILERGEDKVLKPFDQLNRERASGRVFQGFSEGEINFRPTYKYQPLTDMYEKRPDKKLRAPAWCDRVLWYSSRPLRVKQSSYLSSSLNVSDHKPVMSEFVVNVKMIDAGKMREVHQDVVRTLDKFENDSLPKVTLDKVAVDFGDLYYDNKVSLGNLFFFLVSCFFPFFLTLSWFSTFFASSGCPSYTAPRSHRPPRNHPISLPFSSSLFCCPSPFLEQRRLKASK